MTSPLVSVIIPAFNAERYLAGAIGSVLAQEYRPLEIIVVDDGSTDETYDVVQGFGDNVVYIRQPNRGPAAARNAGFQHARADTVGFLDADDLWHQEKLPSQIKCLDNAPSTDIALGHTQRLLYIESGCFRPYGSPELALSLGASLIRRHVFEAVGLFDESMRQADDWDWFMRAREAGISIAVQDQVVQFYRRHDGNLTNRREEGNSGTIKMLRRSLERRRQTYGRASSLPRISLKLPDSSDG